MQFIPASYSKTGQLRLLEVVKKKKILPWKMCLIKVEIGRWVKYLNPRNLERLFLWILRMSRHKVDLQRNSQTFFYIVHNFSGRRRGNRNLRKHLQSPPKIHRNEGERKKEREGEKKKVKYLFLLLRHDSLWVFNI